MPSPALEGIWGLSVALRAPFEPQIPARGTAGKTGRRWSVRRHLGSSVALRAPFEFGRSRCSLAGGNTVLRRAAQAKGAWAERWRKALSLADAETDGQCVKPDWNSRGPRVVVSPMHVVIMGAGAVGAVVGALLAADGHRVSFWVRHAQRERLRELIVERVGGAIVRVDTPACFVAGEAVPPSDWVLVCVRGEQLDAALREVALHLGPERRVAIAAVSLRRVTEQARDAGLLAPAFALHASFGSHAEPGHPARYLWFPFASPTTVTPDGDRARLPVARELARALAHAGLPATSATSLSSTMRVLVAANSVLALGWDVCDWDLARLSGEPDLRRLAAQAMREATRVTLPGQSPLRLLPAFAFELILRVLARFMGPKGREVWRHHGPKSEARPTTSSASCFAKQPRRRCRSQRSPSCSSVAIARGSPALASERSGFGGVLGSTRVVPARGRRSWREHHARARLLAVERLGLADGRSVIRGAPSARLASRFWSCGTARELQACGARAARHAVEHQPSDPQFGGRARGLAVQSSDACGRAHAGGRAVPPQRGAGARAAAERDADAACQQRRGLAAHRDVAGDRQRGVRAALARDRRGARRACDRDQLQPSPRSRERPRLGDAARRRGALRQRRLRRYAMREAGRRVAIAGVRACVARAASDRVAR